MRDLLNFSKDFYMLWFDCDTNLLLWQVKDLFVCNRLLSVELFRQNIDQTVIILWDKDQFILLVCWSIFYQVISEVGWLIFWWLVSIGQFVPIVVHYLFYVIWEVVFVRGYLRCDEVLNLFWLFCFDYFWCCR